MAITSARVSVGTAATALNPIGSAGVQLTIRNGETVVDLGPSGVTSGVGYSLAAAGTVTVDTRYERLRHKTLIRV